MADQVVPVWKGLEEATATCKLVTFTQDVYFIRHGNYNHMDSVEASTLTELGRQEAVKTGMELSKRIRRPIYVYSSTLKCAKQTTELILTNLGSDIKVVYSDVFREVGFTKNPKFPCEDHQFIISSYFACIVIIYI